MPAPRVPRHVVQFYEGEDFLVARVAEFLAAGITAGEPCVVVATPEHRRAFGAALAARGLDASEVLFLDAREMLATFMRDGHPERDLFFASIGGALVSAGAHPHVYGEMVDVLWRDGQREAAARLEALWNELAATCDFVLLCAYPIANFDRAADAMLFDEVCDAHAVVRPAESYAEAEEEDRIREIVRLQHRAAALEKEIAERAFLVDAVTALHRSLDPDERIRDLEHVIVPRIADACTIDCREDAAPETSSDNTLVVPMTVGDRIIGTIRLANPRCTAALAHDLARHAAIALENSRLYKLACEANRTKDEFLATLSHELRTPLTAILGWAKMLSLGIDEELVRTAVETIERSALAQASLVDDLLDLSRIVTGKLSLKQDLVEIESAVDNAVQTLRLAAESRGIRVEVAMPSERTVVSGDPTRLQQIVWNLLSNAIKFSQPGGTVSLAVEREDERVRIIVRDQGHGIDPSFLPHVFEPFRQADGATTRRHGGLGLGLAIVRYIVEHHGGIVEAHSEGRGHGATFTVTLPLASQPRAERQPRRSEGMADLRGRRVLLVDDDADTRELVAAILRRCGAEIAVADSVESARQALAAVKPHVVVTDIAMPEQDGYALMRHLRESGAGIPAVALTASPDRDEAIRAAGFRAHVRKPIDPMEFARVVADLVP